VTKVGTSNPDRTISLKRLQCVVENKKGIILQMILSPRPYFSVNKKECFTNNIYIYIYIYIIFTHARIGVTYNKANIIFNNMWMNVT
jgi:hypothetical protein